jgi:hypothetical protein
MANTHSNPLIEGGAPCTVKKIRRAAEGFRQPDDFQQLSANPLPGKSALPSEAIRRLVELGFRGKAK